MNLWKQLTTMWLLWILTAIMIWGIVWLLLPKQEHKVVQIATEIENTCETKTFLSIN